MKDKVTRIVTIIILIIITISLFTIVVNINGCNTVGGFGKDLTQWSGTNEKDKSRSE